MSDPQPSKRPICRQCGIRIELDGIGENDGMWTDSYGDSACTAGGDGDGLHSYHVPEGYGAAPLPDERLNDAETRQILDALGWDWDEEPGVPSVEDAAAEMLGAVERILAARLAARTPGSEVERLRAALAEQSSAICFDTTCLSCGGYLDQLYDRDMRIEQARAYVDHPGNWSTGDARRRVLLNLLDGKDVPGLREVDGGLL